MYVLENSAALIHESQNVPGLVEAISKRNDYEDLLKRLESADEYFKKFERLIYLEQFYGQTSR